MDGLFISEVYLKKPLPKDSYLNGVPAVAWLAAGNRLALEKPVTFLVGENGAGKSTLIEAIAVACGFNPEGGTKNFSFSTGDTHSTLWSYLTVSRRGMPGDGFFLRAESFYNAASYIDSVDASQFYGGRSLHERSHGESFLALVQNRFSGHGLYILDEPEAALSPMRQLTLLAEMQNLVDSGSQLLVATHSPILMAFPGSATYEIGADGLKLVDYRETEHYQVSRSFLDNPERMLRILLAKD